MNLRGVVRHIKFMELRVSESKLLLGWEVDERLAWSPGRASTLERNQKLPHVVLPDGQMRFRWNEIEPLVRSVPQDAGGKP